jgi:hypothetical protein
MNSKVKPGDIFLVPLSENSLVIGIVLHVSKVFRNAILVVFFDKLIEFSKATEIELERLPMIDTPNYTGIQMIKQGDWSVVDYRPELIEKIPIPELNAGGTVYYKDEVVKQLRTVEEFRLYPTLRGQGKGAVENKLRRHFGIS